MEYKTFESKYRNTKLSNVWKYKEARFINLKSASPRQ